MQPSLLEWCLSYSRSLVPIILTFGRIAELVSDCGKAHGSKWTFRMLGLSVLFAIMYTTKGNHGDPLLSLWGEWVMVCITMIPVTAKCLYFHYPDLTRVITLLMILPLFWAGTILYATRLPAMWRIAEFHLIIIATVTCVAAYMDMYHRLYPPLPESVVEEQKTK